MSKIKDFFNQLSKPLLTMATKVSVDMVDKAEGELGVTFGPEMREYLTTYGSVSYESVELYGLGFSSDYYLNIVAATKELRDMGLPQGYFPIYNIGDGVYAVVTSNDEVYQWSYNKKQADPLICRTLFDYFKTLF